MYKKLSAFLLCVLFCIPVQAMNIVRPYRILFNPQPLPFMHVDCFARFEHGFSVKAYDECSNRTNPLQIWQCNQDAISMLKGFCNNSAPAQLLDTINATDDGTRGHITFCDDITADGVIFAARGYLPHNFMLGVYLPVYTMKLSNVSWHDKTELVNEEDYRVKHYLTDDLAQNVYELGCLNLNGWRRTGLGDIQLIAEWWQDFYQQKQVLKNVRLNARFGFGFPSGLKRDEDRIMAIPFGYDGAVTMMLAGGLNLLWGKYFHAGLDVQ